MKGAEARRERNRAEMRQSVLDAAQKLVTERGIEGLSLRGIARELGYSPAAIYEYFESLEDIVLSLFFEGQDGLTGVLDECIHSLPPETDSPSALLKLADVFRNQALASPELYRFTYNVMKQPKEPKLDEETAGVGLESLILTVERGIERGELIDVPPFTIVLAAWTAAHGFVSLEVSDHFAFFHTNNLADVSAANAINDLYHQLMLGVIRGWTTDKGKALIPS